MRAGGRRDVGRCCEYAGGSCICKADLVVRVSGPAELSGPVQHECRRRWTPRPIHFTELFRPRELDFFGGALQREERVVHHRREDLQRERACYVPGLVGSGRGKHAGMKRWNASLDPSPNPFHGFRSLSMNSGSLLVRAGQLSLGFAFVAYAGTGFMAYRSQPDGVSTPEAGAGCPAAAAAPCGPQCLLCRGADTDTRTTTTGSPK